MHFVNKYMYDQLLMPITFKLGALDFFFYAKMKENLRSTQKCP